MHTCSFKQLIGLHWTFLDPFCFLRPCSVWLLKSDFKLSFVSLLMGHTAVTSKLMMEMLKKLAMTTAHNITIYTSLLHHWVFLVWQRSTATLQFGELDDAPPVFLHLFWMPCHIRGYAYVVTNADRSVMSEYTNWIWSLAIYSADSLPEKICSVNIALNSVLAT